MNGAAATPVIFGEVLFDRFADGSSVLGGAPFNVAWNLQAFGLAPLLVSRVGDDALGAQIRQAMLDWGMSTDGLQQDPLHPTGTVEVSLQAGEPVFDIVSERAYDFIEPVDLAGVKLAGVKLAGVKPAVLYHGSLVARQPVSAAALAALRATSSAPVFVDINLREPWWQRDQVVALLQGADTVKLNQDELERLIAGPQRLLEKARQLLRFSGAGRVILTCGAAGAWIVTAAAEPLQVKPGPQTTAIDSVGAGDAFASVMLLGQLRGWSPEVTARRAQEFAAAVVGVRGATVIERAFYATFSTRWRADEPEY
jgi:fructokinase